MPDEPADKTKIIIDEDWKSRVEAEKEAAAKQPAAPPSAGAAEPSATASSAQGAEPAIPPASLAFLLTTIASQAMASLGHLPNPATGKAEIHLPEAKHFIDMLAVVEEKTAGNRTPQESAILDSFLHELRLMYVDAQSRPAN